jgi:hypothetical protein
MRQIIFALLVLLSFSLFHLEAQDAQPLIQLNDFSTRGISSEEALLIQTLFLSYLSEMGEIITPMGSHIEQVSVIPPSPHDNSMSRSVDYTINGVIRLEQDGHIFLLEITNNRSGETCSVNSMYKTTGELALKARSILEAVFSEVMESEKQNAISPEIIHENRIIGTWKGEAGIEMINLQRGGQGVAFFSSGAQMVLSYDIIDNILRVRQVSPNSERFYYPLPLYAAIHLAAGAEPMVWELTLYKKGAVLSGVRQATAVRMDFERVGELVHRGDIRHVQWTKVLH